MSRISNFQINKEMVDIMNFTELWIYFGYHVASFQEFIFGSTECCVQVKLCWDAEQSFLYLSTLPVMISPPCRAHYAMIPCHPVSLGCSAATVNTPAPCCTPGTPYPAFITIPCGDPVPVQNNPLTYRTRFWYKGQNDRFAHGGQGLNGRPVFVREFGNRPICSLV